MLKILVIGGKRLHIAGWGAKIDKALLDWWHWDRDTILADKKRLDWKVSGGQNELNGLVTLGECGWTDVVKAGSRDSVEWVEEVRQTFVFKKKEKRLRRRRFKEGEPRSQNNTQTSKFIWSCWSKTCKKNKKTKSTTLATFVWFWLLLLSVY